MKDAQIILLDEAIANLDPISEREVLDALSSLQAGRTTIRVTHRLVEMEAASEILVLDRGHLAEQGQHAALLARDGLYAQFWKTQSDTRHDLAIPLSHKGIAVMSS